MRGSETEPGGKCKSTNQSVTETDEGRREFSARRSRCSRSRSRSHSSSRSYSCSRSRSSDSYHQRRRHQKRTHGSRSGSRSVSSHSSRSYSRSSSLSSYLGSRSRSRSPSSCEGSNFQEKDPRDRSMRHRWGNNVWIVGEKVKDLTFHICDICDKPIVVYGRLKPCNHVFCFTCASALPGTCHKCKISYVSCDRCLLGGIFKCTEDSQCCRTYLSQRDLQAHIDHRHKPKTTAAAPITMAATKAGLAPGVTSTANPPPSSTGVAPPSFLIPPPANFSIPPPPFLSTPPTSAALPPANALLVAPSPSQQLSRRVAGSSGGDITSDDAANSAVTIAALAAAIRANPSAAAATAAAAVSLKVAPLCPTSATRLPPPHHPHVPSHLTPNPLWSSGNQAL
uniref:E3 ubiquitin-protein ligase Hakai n=1 Tax=Echinococcus granulosus TaxID=6210 RepID=A0A068WF13_ECHGR|nr:zinc finger protein [Echinococcus granulosus]